MNNSTESGIMCWKNGVKNMNDSNAKSCDLTIFIERSNNFSFAGGHTIPPLQKLVNTLKKDVEEHLCVLPQNNSGNEFLGKNREKEFLQWNHDIIWYIIKEELFSLLVEIKGAIR